jgi:hypothetical protein
MVGLLAGLLKRTGESARAELLFQQHLSPDLGYVDPIGPEAGGTGTGFLRRLEVTQCQSPL